MENFTLEIEDRSDLGTSGSRRHRANGSIPAVVYRGGEAARSVLLNTNEFRRIASKARSSQIFLLKSKDGEQSAIVKDIQRDLVKNIILHVDFQAIREGEEVVVDIPIVIVGEAIGVKNDGGILAVAAREVAISSLPKLIPSSISVDVSALNIGDSIHAEELPLPEGVKLAGNAEEVIVSVVSSRAAALAQADEGSAEAGAAAPEGAAGGEGGEEK